MRPETMLSVSVHKTYLGEIVVEQTRCHVGVFPSFKKELVLDNDKGEYLQAKWERSVTNNFLSNSIYLPGKNGICLWFTSLFYHRTEIKFLRIMRQQGFTTQTWTQLPRNLNLALPQNLQHLHQRIVGKGKTHYLLFEICHSFSTSIFRTILSHLTGDEE